MGEENVQIMIKIEKLKKQYGNGSSSCVALNNLNLEIPQGKFVTITGKSGSGKTTLLNMIGLIDKPDSGKIHIEGGAKQLQLK